MELAYKAVLLILHWFLSNS